MERISLAEPANIHEPVNLNMERSTLGQKAWFAQPSVNHAPYQRDGLLLPSDLERVNGRAEVAVENPGHNTTPMQASTRSWRVSEYFNDRGADWREAIRPHHESEEPHQRGVPCSNVQQEGDGGIWQLSGRFNVSDNTQSGYYAGSSSVRNVGPGVRTRQYGSRCLPDDVSYLTELHRDWDNTPTMEIDDSSGYSLSKPYSMPNSNGVDRGLVNTRDHNMNECMTEASSYFNAHLHFDEGVKQFQCSSCGQELPSADDLVRHITSLHTRESGIIQSKVMTSWIPYPQSERGAYQCDFSRIPPAESKQGMTLLQTDCSSFKRRISEGDSCSVTSYTDDEEPVFKITNVRSMREGSPQNGEECSSKQDAGVDNGVSSLQVDTLHDTYSSYEVADKGEKISFSFQEKQKGPRYRTIWWPTHESSMPPETVQGPAPSVSQVEEPELDKPPNATEQSNHIFAKGCPIPHDARVANTPETTGVKVVGQRVCTVEHEDNVQKGFHFTESQNEVGEADDDKEGENPIHKGSTKSETATDIREFRCSTCNEAFQVEHLLRSHLTTHVMIYDDGHRCDKDSRLMENEGGGKLMPQGYLSESQLSLPHIQHTASTPDAGHLLRSCANPIAQQNTKSGMESHTNLANTCTICKAVFTSGLAFALHVSLHTEEQPMDLSLGANRAERNRVTLAAPGERHTELPCKDELLAGVISEDVALEKEQYNKQGPDRAESNPIMKSHSPMAICDSVPGASGGVGQTDETDVAKRAAWLESMGRERESSEDEHEHEQINKMKNRPISLNNLTDAKHVTQPNFCSQCRLVLPDRYSLVVHMAKHTNKVKSMYKRRVCTERFVFKDSVMSHTATLGTTKPYKCKYCNNTFKHKRTRQRHLKQFHVDNWPYKCAVCQEIFRRSRKLRQHVKQQHYAEPSQEIKQNRRTDQAESDSLVGGDIPPKAAGSGTLRGQSEMPATEDNVMKANSSTSSSHVSDHVSKRLHEFENAIAESDGVVVCLLCMGRFKGRSEYEKHMEIHIGQNTHPCHLCDEKFDTSKQLEEHHVVHGMAAKFRKRTAAFVEQPVIKVKVIQWEYGETEGSATTHRHECSLCRVRYSSRRTYRAHMAKHATGFRQKCHGCDETFPKKEFLEEHLRTCHCVI